MLITQFKGKSFRKHVLDMTGRDLTRRHFLGTVGTGTGGLTVSLAGCTADDASTDETIRDDDTDDGERSSDEEEVNDTDGDTEGTEDAEEEESLDPPENGAVVFVYDDGPIEDYTQAFPAHQEFDAPATTGIVSGWIGQSDDWMDVEHLEELAAAGWEICSHTTQHMPLAAYELTEDVGPEDTAIHAEEYRHGHTDGLTIEITDGDRSVSREVAGLGGEPGGNRSVLLEQSVGDSFAASNTVIRHPEEQMHEALGESRRELEEFGFEINTLLAPYDDFDEWSMEFVPEYYDGVANARIGSRINDPAGVDPFQTQRFYFIEFTTREAVQQDLDEIAEDGALGVFGAHTFKEEVTEERIRETLEWVDERGIEVITLREAIERFTH